MIEMVESIAVNCKDIAVARARMALKQREFSYYRVTDSLRRAQYVVVMNVYNEAPRLPFLLQYYEKLGFEEFIVVDNNSTDGTFDLLEPRGNVSIIRAHGAFKGARFGSDWVNGILNRLCDSKWVLYVDADEFLVYPDCDQKNIAALTHELSARNVRSMQCIMIDMYSDRPTSQNQYKMGQDPLEVCCFFDSGGYERRLDPIRKTTWIKGGVRGRKFFAGEIWDGPALNKTPLVYWRPGYAFLRVAHNLWPPALNDASGACDGTTLGALLHFKFTSTFNEKVAEEAARNQHAAEYNVYQKALENNAADSFMCDRSVKYVDWRSLREHNLI